MLMFIHYDAAGPTHPNTINVSMPVYLPTCLKLQFVNPL